MGTKQKSRRPRRAPAGDDVRQVLDAIRHIVKALRVASRAAEKRVGLSAAQLFALHKLADSRALSLNELAERTFTHQSSVSVVVSRLVDRGLVLRRRSAADGRRIELTLTTAGRALMRRAPEAAQERLIAGLARLPPGARHILAEALTGMVKAMGVADEPAGMFFEEGRRHRG